MLPADEAGAFTESQVSELTELSRSQLARWSREGIFPASFEGESREFSRIYTFRDLVGLRTLASLRQHGVSMQELRRASEFLRREHASPWSSLRFWIGGRVRGQHAWRLYFGDPATGTPITAGPPFQGGIPVALEEIASALRERVAAARGRRPEDVGKIVSTRHVVSGRPAFAGTRIAVSVVREYLDDGAPDEEILREFPSLRQADLDAARREPRATTKKPRAA